MRAARLPCRLLKGLRTRSALVRAAHLARYPILRRLGPRSVDRVVLLGGCGKGLEPAAEPGELVAVRLEHVALELDDQAARRGEVVGRPREQPPVVVEAVAAREDRGRRLVVVARRFRGQV